MQLSNLLNYVKFNLLINHNRSQASFISIAFLTLPTIIGKCFDFVLSVCPSVLKLDILSLTQIYHVLSRVAMVCSGGHGIANEVRKIHSRVTGALRSIILLDGLRRKITLDVF